MRHPRANRINSFSMPVTESKRLAAVLRNHIENIDSSNPSALPLAALEARLNLPHYAPKLAYQLSLARRGAIDALYVTGLPEEPDIAPVLTLTLTYTLGFAFNYTTQNSGMLVMTIRPDRTVKAVNTNATTEEFAWHTDDALVPRNLRVQWISLFGVHNPPNTLTGYAPIAPVIQRLSARTRDVLSELRFSVRAPQSFNLGSDIWSEPRAILSTDEQGALEVGWPSYATRPVNQNDVEANLALAELAAGIDAFAVRVPIDPGCFLTFNNLRGVHMRTAIGDGDRLVFRTYARSDLSELRAVTRSYGPIFDTRAVIAQAIESTVAAA